LNQEVLKPIIDTITREVIKRLKDRINEQKEQKKKLLLVFTGGTGNFDKVMSQLITLSQEYHFLALFTPAFEKAIGREKVRQDIEFEDVSKEGLYDALSKIDTVIFPTLTQNTAAKASIGIRDSLGSEALACGLLLKKKVIAVTDSIPLRSMPVAYGRMVGEILKRLEQLGVYMCEGEELSEILLKRNDSVSIKQAVNTTAAKESVSSEKLTQTEAFVFEEKNPVTADVIYKAALEGYERIILKPKTIVTPMAKDTAKDKKITIEWAVN
jgi:flavoprotein